MTPDISPPKIPLVTDPPPNAVKVSTTDVLASVGAKDKKQRGKKSTKKKREANRKHTWMSGWKLGSMGFFTYL